VIPERQRFDAIQYDAPRFARNLGTGEPLASGTTTRPARITVHHDPDHPSAVTLPVRAEDGASG